MGPNWSHKRIYGHIFTHYPKKWLWVPFEPINVSTGIFTDAHSGPGNGTKLVPSTYLRAHFHALSRKNALGPFQAHSSPSTYLQAYLRMPILDWEMEPNGSHQRIYGDIFTHYPEKWLWAPFKPINVSTGIFTDAHSVLGNGTKLVQSTYLRSYFYALSQKIALGSIWGHQSIYGHFHWYPFWTGKWDQSINVSMGKLKDVYFGSKEWITSYLQSFFQNICRFFLALVIHSLGVRHQEIGPPTYWWREAKKTSINVLEHSQLWGISQGGAPEHCFAQGPNKP